MFSKVFFLLFYVIFGGFLGISLSLLFSLLSLFHFCIYLTFKVTLFLCFFLGDGRFFNSWLNAWFGSVSGLLFRFKLVLNLLFTRIGLRLYDFFCCNTCYSILIARHFSELRVLFLSLLSCFLFLRHTMMLMSLCLCFGRDLGQGGLLRCLS